MALPCEVKRIVDNLSSVDHWNILKSEKGIEFGVSVVI